MILREMDNCLEIKVVSKENAKKYKNSKPYWSENLHVAWSNMVKAEKTIKVIVVIEI